MKRSKFTRADVMAALDFIVVAILLVFATKWAYEQYMSSAPYIDPAKYPVRGIDASHHNGMMNLHHAVNKGNVEFIFLKATEGVDFRDPDFNLNYQKAREVGIPVGAYHYFRYDQDGVAQALNLLKAVKGKNLDLGVAIDVENAGNVKNVDPAIINRHLSDMLEHLAMVGMHTTIYTNRGEYYSILKQEDREGVDIWLAHRGGELERLEPDLVKSVKFWQYYHKGKVPGINGDVDLNAFKGTRREWEQHLRTIKREKSSYKDRIKQ